MIAKIKGVLTETDQNIGIIETAGGISYQLYLTPQILSKNPVGSSVDIYTYLQVREDAQVLFGFESKQQFRFFTLLLSVSGVGPKTAYGIISYVNVNELIEAARTNNVDFYSHIPGLGKKTAMKILLELSQRANKGFSFDAFYISDEDKIVIDTLTTLGLSSLEAKNLLGKLPKNLSVEEKVKSALKHLKQ